MKNILDQCISNGGTCTAREYFIYNRHKLDFYVFSEGSSQIYGFIRGGACIQQLETGGTETQKV